ncbi:MAG TPA: aminoglycoside phosphotransferase family protein [Pseudonocardiaceae bacterium]|jgi:aminoglycoside phosphotransferase (APT) family kinase protein|nr:aminoglycoside phosphotransferase family protein [Pseudonocardiaceae bacterium]
MTNDEPAEPADVTPELVRALLAEQFPAWADEALAPVGKPGVDNMTFRLGPDKLVRMPRFPRWVGQVLREQRWLPVLAPRLPLAVPVPLAQGEPGAGYPFPWSVYAWLDGDNATRSALVDQQQAARDLAGFLRALWAIDPTDGPPPEWSNGFRGVDMADGRDSAIVDWRIERRIAALDRLADTAALRAVFATALAAPVWPTPPVWVHGDPAPGNLLVRDGRLSAVIDFGTVAVGDPAVDLIGAWTLLSPAGREVFRAELSIDDATWARGRGWALSALLPAPERWDDEARRGLDELVGDHRHLG